MNGAQQLKNTQMYKTKNGKKPLMSAQSFQVKGDVGYPIDDNYQDLSFKQENDRIKVKCSRS